MSRDQVCVENQRARAYQEHHEEIKQRNRDYYRLHREEVLQRLKERYKSRKILEPTRQCYLKESRAMLKGKNTKGKNRCIDLPETCL